MERELMNKVANGCMGLIAWIESGALHGKMENEFRVLIRRSERIMRSWLGVNLSGIELCRATIERTNE